MKLRNYTIIISLITRTCTHLKNRHDVHVTVQENRRLRRLHSYPRKNHDWSFGVYIVDLNRQAKGFGLFLQERHTVIWKNDMNKIYMRKGMYVTEIFSGEQYSCITLVIFI